MINNGEIKNKIDRRSGHFLCHKCGQDAGAGVVVKGFVHCVRCGQEIKESKTT